LSDTRFPEKVSALLNRYAVSPELVELEVTETAFVAGDEACLAILDKLSKLGVSIALDDFGTGYTAFSQLIHYPADCLKIDRSFVAEIFSDNRAQSQMT
ncbi:GGDEF-domain containing protein, partial [Pseudoalteromonas sp. S407]